MCELSDKAKELVGLEGWAAWKFEAIENGVLCTGAVCPPITRGANKGWPNYRKYDKKTLKTVFVKRS